MHEQEIKFQPYQALCKHCQSVCSMQVQ